MRIGIIGSAGCGKTELALSVSKQLSVPALLSRDITEFILRRDGYDYGSGIQIERFLANTGRQNEILRKTIEQQSVPDFITDRTVVDLAAYAVCELHHSDATALRHIVETCRKHVTDYTHLFLCPWKDVPVENTMKRTLNPWYQYLIHVVEMGILGDWGLNGVAVLQGDMDERVKQILADVRGYPS